ncbi:MAG: MerR family DNA-binding protein [Myxococcota bacterium]
MRFIKRAKELGFPLKEIRQLMALETNPAATAADVKRLAEERLADIEERIRSLQRMRRALRRVTEEARDRHGTLSLARGLEVSRTAIAGTER